MITLDKSSDIFDTKPFINEEVTFNLMHYIRETETPMIMINEKNTFIIAEEAPNQYPVWVWTEEGIGVYECETLANDFYNIFCERNKLMFVAKPLIADFLATVYGKRRNLAWKIDLCMESYCCNEVIKLNYVDGEIFKATMGNVEIISELFAGFINDCFGKNTTSDKQTETAKQFIQRDNLYVWKVNGEIVSMANIAHRSSRHARLNEVYTVPSKRMKGYAGALVGNLCKIIHSENRVPMLYTDLSNPASNKAYKKVGFIECGKVNKIKFIIE